MRFTLNAHKKQIIRFPHPSNGKPAVAGDPGSAQDDTLVGMTPSENSFLAPC